jgi:hypothetical protein
MAGTVLRRHFDDDAGRLRVGNLLTVGQSGRDVGVETEPDVEIVAVRTGQLAV